MLSYARRAPEFGFRAATVEFDFAEVMERVQRVIRQIEPHDSVERYSMLGVEVFEREARLHSPYEIDLGDRVISARNIIIATGARPSVPQLPGLEQIDYLTSDTVWGLRALPARLLVLGGGPIGCELAQCFQRLGSAVTLVQRDARLLPREDVEVSAMVAERLRAEGMQVLTAHRALRFERSADGNALVCEHHGREITIGFDRVLLALGRTANVRGFGLEELGVKLTRHGTLEADALLRTNFPNIYVCGDVTGPYQFTHVAAHQAWYAAVNALFSPFKTFQVDYRVIPWATFTDPEVARVGLNEREASERGIAYEVSRYDIDDLDRAIVDGEAHGMVKVLTVPGKDRILGVTIVGHHAGELLAEFVSAMKHGLGLNKILGTIHVYPTLTEANKYSAGVWRRNHAPQKLLAWLARFHAWRRGA
jgi:pyruvate/2-oxoglutarate dehydrogenase complex dihydrolipoamide dehydrogenase (E3) component